MDYAKLIFLALRLKRNTWLTLTHGFTVSSFKCYQKSFVFWKKQ